jgi:hypothetical protein
MTRRGFLRSAGASPLLLFGSRANAAPVSFNQIYSLRSLGDRNGPRYLDGHTHDGTVALVANLVKPYYGTKWQLVSAGNGAVAFRCKGNLPGPMWLDGRTHDGSVGLAPATTGGFTGTRWQLIEVAGGYTLKCLGKVDGPRWLDGRTHNGSVGLAKSTDPPFTGTKWEIKPYPRCIDEPCPLPW